MSDKILLTQDMVASNDILNPFIHHLELTTTYDKIRVSEYFSATIKIFLYSNLWSLLKHSCEFVLYLI